MSLLLGGLFLPWACRVLLGTCDALLFLLDLMVSTDTVTSFSGHCQMHRGPLAAKALWWSMQELRSRHLFVSYSVLCVCVHVCTISNAYTREFYQYFDGPACLILLIFFFFTNFTTFFFFFYQLLLFTNFSLPQTYLRAVCPSSHAYSPCLTASLHTPSPPHCAPHPPWPEWIFSRETP